MGANMRNGVPAKTVLTERGRMRIEVLETGTESLPGDRAALGEFAGGFRAVPWIRRGAAPGHRHDHRD